MAFRYPVRVTSDNNDPSTFSWEASYTQAAPGDGDWIIIPPGRGAAVELEVTAGEGYVEATLNSLAEIMAGTATGVKWTKSNVTETTQDYVKRCSGVRASNVAGTTKIKVII